MGQLSSRKYRTEEEAFGRNNLNILSILGEMLNCFGINCFHGNQNHKRKRYPGQNNSYRGDNDFQTNMASLNKDYDEISSFPSDASYQSLYSDQGIFKGNDTTKYMVEVVEVYKHKKWWPEHMTLRSKVIVLLDNSPKVWIMWKQASDYLCVFGKNVKGTGLLYVTVVKVGSIQSLRLMSGTEPIVKEVSKNDQRLFKIMSTSRTHKKILYHLNTKLFVGIDKNGSLVLTTEVNAVSWDIKPKLK